MMRRFFRWLGGPPVIVVSHPSPDPYRCGFSCGATFQTQSQRNAHEVAAERAGSCDRIGCGQYRPDRRG